MGGWVDLIVVRYISLLLFIGLAFWGCKDYSDDDGKYGGGEGGFIAGELKKEQELINFVNY